MISIIVPVHNTEEYLEKCISSIRNQTHRDIEIILINDGSTDKSPEICDYHASLDNRITVIHKKNGGVATARNDGLKIAQGKYVGFVDSDDYISENMYEEMYKSALAHDADIVESGIERITLSGHILASNYKNKVLTENKNCFREYCEGNIDQSSCTKIFKRELLENIDFGTFRHNEDHYFNTQVFLRCKTLVIKSENFYKYIYHPTSAVRKPFSRSREDAVAANKLMYKICHQVYPEYSFFFARHVARSSLNCYLGFDKSDFTDKKEMKEKYWNDFVLFFRKSKILYPLTGASILLTSFRISPKLAMLLLDVKRRFNS